jgi:plastocyanin
MTTPDRRAPRHRTAPLLTLLALLALLPLIGCTGAAPTPTAAPAEAPPADESPAAGGEQVTLVNFAFDPTELTVPAGTTVTFRNDDAALHSVSEGSDGQVADDAAFDEDVESGTSIEIPFDEAGTFQVTCKYHPQMNMTVTVEG